MPCNERFISLSPAQLSASPYESVMGPRCVTPHLCYPLKENSETLLAFSCPLAATPLRGLLDQNKLKKALWTLAVFNLSPSLVLTPALSPSPSRPLFFSSCFRFSLLKKSVYTREKKRHLFIPSTMHNLSFQLIHCHTRTCPSSHFKTSASLYLAFVSFILSLLYILTRPSLFCSLIFSGYECALLDCPHCPFTLSVLPRISSVAMVTSLPPCWKTSLCSHKKRYLPHSRVMRWDSPAAQ